MTPRTRSSPPRPGSRRGPSVPAAERWRVETARHAGGSLRQGLAAFSTHPRLVLETRNQVDQFLAGGSTWSASSGQAVDSTAVQRLSGTLWARSRRQNPNLLQPASSLLQPALLAAPSSTY